MKRALLIAACVGVVAATALVAYQTVMQEHEYRDLLSRGELALRNRDTLSAVEAFSGAIALHPDSMLPYLRRGETYQLLGDLEGASSDLRRASELDPSSIRPLDALGNVLYDQGRLPQAAAAYQRRLEIDDAAPAVGYRLALTRYRLGDLAGALTEIDRVIALDDTLPEAHYLRGLCLRDTLRLADAVESFEAALTRSPGLIAAREELADVYGALGQHGDELEQLQVVAGLDRQSVDRQLSIALALARAARTARTPVAQQRSADLAVLTLGRALDRVPDDPEVYGALGRVWLDVARTRGDQVVLARALEALERAAAAPTAGSDIVSAYGQALRDAGRIDAAERVLQDAIRRFPIDPGALLAYADVAETRRHFAEARSALVSYDALVSDDEQAVGRAGRIAVLSLRLQDPVTAAAWFQRVVDSEPENVDAVSALVGAHLAAGRNTEARTAITRGLARHPDDRTLLALAREASLPD